MERDLWFGLTIVLTVAVGVFIAHRLKAARQPARAASALAAALLVGGGMSFAWTAIDQAMIDARAKDDDNVWRGVRSEIVARYPEMGELMALSPPIEKTFKTALVPIARKAGATTDQGPLIAATNRASKQAFAQHVFPVVVHGSDAALNAWGAAQLALLQAVQAISTEACGDYAMSGVNRYSPDQGVDAALRAASRALIDAYKTSDAARHDLPTAEASRALFDKALAGAQPPFTAAERLALGALAQSPREAQCSLSIRLLQAIAALDAADAASLHRVIMRKMVAPP